jgi:type I restriction enzyme S subunit
MVPLREVLTKEDEWITLLPDATYREVTVRLWSKGVVLRREIKGAEIAASRSMLVRKQQFILSRIDARNGAFGIVPNDFDGAIVSNDFPSFTVNPERLEPDYLKWLSRTSGFVELCKAASERSSSALLNT